MRRKSVIIILCQMLLGGIIAFAILSLLCSFYYNMPIHTSCTDGATDYVWEPSHLYIRGIEGFGYGRTNNEGYTNLFDYENNMPIDVLLMGSSHMEAFHLPLEKSTSSILNQLLPEYTVYNIGISAHTFPICASNLPAAVEKYKPQKYIVIETSTVHFSDDELNGAINKTLPELSSLSEGYLRILQRIPYLRLLYEHWKTTLKAQLNKLRGTVQESSPENTSDSQNGIGPYTNEDLLPVLLDQIANCAKETGASVIILYHPYLDLMEDGSLHFEEDSAEVQFLISCCEDKGILVLDMTNRFQKEYEEQGILPYGFYNSSVGNGHLNEDGHAMIADELYQLIGGEG